MQLKHETFIFDFDSTFIRVEALDTLCEVIYEDSTAGKQILSEIQRLTDLGMEGELSLKESLSQRIQLLQANRDHLGDTIKHLREKVSASVIRNRAFFKQHRDDIYIISNGFKEIIIPIVQEYGIKPENVLANTFKFDHEGHIIGFDEKDELCENKGKVHKIRDLELGENVIMIGDGYTDYETIEEGVVSKFYAYVEKCES